MTRDGLQRLRSELEALRGHIKSIRPREFIHIAEAVGRERKKKRTGEPVWDRKGWFPLSIPDHPGTLKPKTAGNIADQLEEDLDKIEAQLDAQEAGNGKDRTRGH